MIHHVSIPATAPRAVAMALAELMGGKCYRFPGPAAGAFMAVSGGAHGTLIDVYPETVAERGVSTSAPIADHAFHLLLSVPVPVDEAEVFRIGARMGWRTQRCGRGEPGGAPLFEVIELWVENRLIIEVATPEMLPDYARLIQFETLDAFFGQKAA